MEFLLKAFGVLSVLGLILVLPLRSHWSRIFGLMDVFLIVGAIAIDGFLIYTFFIAKGHEPITGMELFNAIVIGFGLGIIGLIRFLGCLSRCNSVLEMIALPFVLVSMVGAFAIIILLTFAALGLGKGSDDHVVIWHD